MLRVLCPGFCDFDERNAGFKAMIRLAIEGARRSQRHSGLCGQAPLDYPEMGAHLVELGIDSTSLNPDTVLKTTRQILEVKNILLQLSSDNNYDSDESAT